MPFCERMHFRTKHFRWFLHISIILFRLLFILGMTPSQPSIPPYATPAFSSQPPVDKQQFNSSLPSPAPPPTSTPPSTSRPPSPTGSIVGQGVELRMGDIAGMSLSTGLTPKKKNPRGRAGSVFPPSAGSVWGNVGLNCALSTSGSSMDKKKSKSIISPAR